MSERTWKSAQPSSSLTRLQPCSEVSSNIVASRPAPRHEDPRTAYQAGDPVAADHWRAKAPPSARSASPIATLPISARQCDGSATTTPSPSGCRTWRSWHERVRLPPQLPGRHDDEPDPVPKADPPTGSPAAAGTHQGDVTGVGYHVGYDSPSQFSREYRRKFGVLPSQDGGRRSGPAPSVAPSLPLTPMLCDSGVRTRLHRSGG